MTDVSERFLRYVRVSTPSDEAGEGTPSTACQFDLAHMLADDMRKLGLSDVRVTDNCFVYGVLPATEGLEDLPCMGLVAHMDTAPAYCGVDVKPQVIENYDGGDILLPATGEKLSPARFPHLAAMKGKTLITTDGSTLLGADDKAGVAEILSALKAVIDQRLPHRKIAVAFTPDEEIGLGVHAFDVQGFGAEYAYTVDGGAPGDLNYENFNACEATVAFRGVSVHPGGAKGMMVNACLLAMEFNALLPGAETPRLTEGREGFFHLEGMQGDPVEARLVYIVRDHDAGSFERRKRQLRHIEKTLNERWGAGSVTLAIREQYRNMKEKLEPCFYVVENARRAMREAGFEPMETAIRGGTDGAQLSYMGLPCPNLCTGGHGCHGPYEHIAVEDMEACVRMLVSLITLR